MDSPSPYAPTASDSPLLSSEPGKRSRLLAFCALFLSTCIVMGMLITQQSFKRMFEEFGIEVSFLSILAIHPGLPLLLLAAVLVSVAKEFAFKWRRFANAWNLALICLALFCLSVYVLGVFVPIVNLVQAMGK